MIPFLREVGVAAPLPIADVDTDQIIPSRFLKGVTREGLGRGLFADLRYRRDGSEDPDFVLNREPWRNARFLVTRENFGCGSSREHAPWALAGFGIRAILAPSFADIFQNNCAKNGLLPARLAAADVERLLALANDPLRAEITVDLETQQVCTEEGERFAILIDANARDALLSGADEIARSLEYASEIEAFERRHLGDVPAISPFSEWPAPRP